MMQQRKDFFTWLKHVSCDKERDDVVSDFAHDFYRDKSKPYKIKSDEQWDAFCGTLPDHAYQALVEAFREFESR